MCRMKSEPPEIVPTGWYNATEAAKRLGMSRTTFWRNVKAGKIKKHLRRVDGKSCYRGKDLLNIWNSFY